MIGGRATEGENERAAGRVSGGACGRWVEGKDEERDDRERLGGVTKERWWDLHVGLSWRQISSKLSRTCRMVCLFFSAWSEGVTI